MNLLSKFLTLPARIKAAAIGAIVLIVALSGALGWSYWKGQQSAQPKVEAAQEQAAVSDLTALGANETARQVEIVVRQAADAYRVSSDLAIEAAKSEDADAPLDPARAARLHAADRSLCAQRPGLVGCEAVAPSGDAEAR